MSALTAQPENEDISPESGSALRNYRGTKWQKLEVRQIPTVQ